ncbi:MAG: hypothetical protein PHU94_00140 [Bacilli bacterium]|nr:hypothetical protein [Bacilli bacterium]MDD4733887.1 hypothetical protein [Bacilli bacterium]
MNVIIANKYQAMLTGLEIEVMKTKYGEFDVDEIISNFQNFFFQRMILDLTAIKNYTDIKNLQKLSMALDMDKVILLLDDTVENTSSEYLTKLISMGIYNFTTNMEGLMYLYNNPNSYRDVAHIQQLEPVVVESETETTKKVIKKSETKESFQPKVETRVLGIKNATQHAGATTLAYMMKKELSKNYSVIAVELDKRDFAFFRDNELKSIASNEIGNFINMYKDVEIIIIDVNDSISADPFIGEYIYLIEPSIIKLNRLMLVNPTLLQRISKEKVILNQSLLASKDVLEFEYESKLKVLYNLPPLNDRDKESFAMNQFLFSLGFHRQDPSEEKSKKSKILGIF